MGVVTLRVWLLRDVVAPSGLAAPTWPQEKLIEELSAKVCKTKYSSGLRNRLKLSVLEVERIYHGLQSFICTCLCLSCDSALPEAYAIVPCQRTL